VLVPFYSDTELVNYLSLHETAKIGLIFAVRPILPDCMSDFCKHPTNGHHIAQKWMER
jgi:hypothetical protein